ncbi:MAG: hypothetical protein OXE99_12205 [Cellvibrionales bacterium]|nr:hypothetical protein [Cellvibrionales bacterium]
MIKIMVGCWIIFLMGCAVNKGKEADPLLLSTQILNQELKQKYNRDLSILIGRMDGMNQAVVDGLTETKNTSLDNKALSIEAKGLAETNHRKIESLEKQIKVLMGLLGETDTDTTELEESDDPDVEALFD